MNKSLAALVALMLAVHAGQTPLLAAADEMSRASVTDLGRRLLLLDALGEISSLKVSSEMLSVPTNWSEIQAAQVSPQRRSWASRHPVLTGTSLGFGFGFAIGQATAFWDLEPWARGLTVGGIGAAAGAYVGWILGRD